MIDKRVVVAATTVVATGIIVLIVFWMKGTRSKDSGKRYPPTSSALSLFRALLRRGLKVVPEHFMRSAEKLGPVISYNFGGSRVIILNGKEAISEALLRQSEAFADRTLFWTETNVLNPKLQGIIFARYDDSFKKNHKLCLAILKEFGFGVNSVSETRILRQVESLKDNFLKFNGRPFDPKPLTIEATFNVVSCILFGERFIASDTCSRICDAIILYSRNLGFALEIAPVLRFLPSFRRQISGMIKCQNDLFLDIEEGINSSKSVDCESTFARRFIEIQGPNYDHQDLLFIIRDLCLASSDTVSTTLLWAMIELANYPEIQKKIQREIDEVISKNRLPSLDDKPHLPYTEAVILEVLRRHMLAPLYMPHATLKDTEVLGWFIPKESLVIANAFSAHMDPKVWKDPENFRPERFLDGKGTMTGSEQVIPFGLGKRSCLGEILARQEVFLFLTSLVQGFDIRPPEGQDSIEVREVFGVGVFPSEFEARLIPRLDNQDFEK